MKKKENSPYAYLRCFDALPQQEGLDLYLDDELYIKDILYEDFSEYKKITPGEHSLYVTHHESSTIICTRQIWITKERIYTLILSFDLKCQVPNLYLINDIQRTIPDNYFLLRVGHYTTNDQIISVILGEKKFKKVLSHQLTNYLTFEPQTFDVHVKAVDTEEDLYTLLKTSLKPFRFYTIYFIGMGNKAFPFKLVLSIDGNSFISF